MAGQDKIPYANGVPKTVPTNGLSVTRSANLQAENDHSSPTSQSSKCSSVKPHCEPEEIDAKSTSESGNGLGELPTQVADIVMKNESCNEASDSSQRDSIEQNGRCTKQDTNSQPPPPSPLPPLSTSPPSSDAELPSPTDDGDTNSPLSKRFKSMPDNRGLTPLSIYEPSTSKASYQNPVGFGLATNSDSQAESLECSDAGQTSSESLSH